MWILSYEKDGALEVQGKSGTPVWGDFADQVRQIVPDEHRPEDVSLAPTIIPPEYRFRAFYRLKDIGDGKKVTEFTRAVAEPKEAKK